MAGISARAVRLLDRDGDGVLDFDFDSDGDVDIDDMRALNARLLAGDWHLIEMEYCHGYWIGASCHRLDGFNQPGAQIALFDAAVQHGPRTAVVQLQKAAGAKPDGILGTRTATLIGAYYWPTLMERILAGRRAYYAAIIKARPASAVFAKGWENRMIRLEEEIAR